MLSQSVILLPELLAEIEGFIKEKQALGLHNKRGVHPRRSHLELEQYDKWLKEKEEDENKRKRAKKAG